jgi:hypothetical protein
MARCRNCKNLIRIYVDSAFAWFEERRKCKAKNLVFEDYYEIEKIRECEAYDPHEMPTHMHITEQTN